MTIEQQVKDIQTKVTQLQTAVSNIQFVLNGLNVSVDLAPVLDAIAAFRASITPTCENGATALAVANLQTTADTILADIATP